MTEAKEIQEQAQRFAIDRLRASESSSHSWEDDCVTFEGDLEDKLTALKLRDERYELFEAEAKLAFYGVMTDRANITKWRRSRDRACDVLMEEARADDKLQAADMAHDIAGDR